MKWLLVLAFLNAQGEVTLITKPVASPQECSELMTEFHTASEDVVFEAQCVNVVNVLGEGVPKKEAFNG